MKEQGNDLSKRIRFLRIRKGMTQEQLASAMGLKNRDSISKIELGKQDISTQQISLLADIFDVSISYLLYCLPIVAFSVIQRDKKYTFW